MKRYVLLLLATLTSFNLATAANVELRGRDLKKTAKGVEISEQASRLSGYIKDLLDEGVMTGAISVALPHKAVELAAPYFTKALEAYSNIAADVTKEVRVAYRSKVASQLAPNMQDLSKEELVMLMHAAFYLNFPELVDAAAQPIANMLTWENLAYFKENLLGEMQAAIARGMPEALFPLVFDRPAKEHAFDPTWKFFELSEDGKLAVAISEAQQPEAGLSDIHIVEIESGRSLLTKGNVDLSWLSRDGTRVLFIGDEDEVWDIRQRTRICTMQWDFHQLDRMNKNGRSILIHDDYGPSLWSGDTGSRLRSYGSQDQGKAEAVSFTHDESGVIALFKDGTARVWDVSSGQLLRTIPEAADKFDPHLHVSAYGPIIGTCEEVMPGESEGFLEEGSQTHKVKIWNWKTGELLGELKKEGVYPSIAAGKPFSRDGKYVIVQGTRAAPEGATNPYLINLSIWDISRQEEIASFFEYEYGEIKVVFSVDGSQITVIHKQDAYIFDARSGQKLMTFKHPVTDEEEQWVLAFHRTADGKQLLTSYGNRIYTWDINTPAIRTYLRHLSLENILLILTLYREHQKDPKVAINLHRLAAKTPGEIKPQLTRFLTAFPPEIRDALITRFRIVHPHTALRRRRRGRLSGHRRA